MNVNKTTVAHLAILALPCEVPNFYTGVDRKCVHQSFLHRGLYVTSSLPSSIFCASFLAHASATVTTFLYISGC